MTDHYAPDQPSEITLTKLREWDLAHDAAGALDYLARNWITPYGSVRRQLTSNEWGMLEAFRANAQVSGWRLSTWGGLHIFEYPEGA